MDLDLCPALVRSNRPADFHLSAFQGFQGAELGAVGGEDDTRKRTTAVIGAKIKKSIPRARSKYPEDSPRDAARFPDVRRRVMNIQAAVFAGCALAGRVRRAAQAESICHQRAQAGGQHCCSRN